MLDNIKPMSSFFRFIFLCSFLFTLSSCSSFNKKKVKEELKKNDEFDKVIKIEKIKIPKKVKSIKKNKSKIKKKKITKKKSKKNKAKKSKSKPIVKVSKKIKKKKVLRQPRLEDDENFDGRRPLVEPFHVGEEVTLGISYFAVEAGKFTMKVKPMVQVNGEKSYHFQYLIRTSPLFNMFYSVDDVAETFVNYETLVPYSYEIHIDESKQVGETKTYFDWQKNKAMMWDKKKRPGKKVEKRKVEWNILKYSQNVFSAAYYLRAFTLKVGKKLRVRVAHEGKNIIMTAKVLRREKIYTKLGAFDTFVVKPSFNVEGKFKPTGENLLWLTADDRKFIVRMESKIRIGTIIGKVQKIVK